MESSQFKNADEEYECQLFGYTSSSVHEGLHDLLEQIVGEILASMERRIVSKFQLNERSVAQARVNLHQIYKESIEKHSAEMKGVVQQYFCVPKNVLLPDDELQKKQFTEADEEAIMEKLNASRNKLLALTAFEKKLQEKCDTFLQYKKVSGTITDYSNDFEDFYKNVCEFNKSTVEEISPMNKIVEYFINNFANMKI
ncbi:hypothetical protein O3M35_001992 [Rhynocoris fuscipes]|uniref:Protein MIS12 homolog n=1 Tax=Rhynocoris fuscipes TaxID=488301 RepID=A0AAW1CR54_9HEMI